MNIEEVVIFVINRNHNERKKLIRDLKKSIYYQFKKDYQFKIFTIKKTKEFKFFSQEKKEEFRECKVNQLLEKIDSASIVLIPENDKVLGLMNKILNFRKYKIFSYQNNLRLKHINKCKPHTSSNEIESNFFEKSSRKLGDDVFYYFPYGFASRYMGLGPIDEFGFRNKTPLKKINKKANNEKRILIFGGSGAWSTQVFFDYYFGNVLEKLLRNHYKKYKINIYNLSQPSAITLNDISNFILFGKDLSPDLVICHSGLNDLAFGAYSDKNLLANYQISYPFQLETWAETLNIYGSSSNKSFLKENISELVIKNFPDVIVKAFLKRLLDFKKLVESYNIKFVFGLQPQIYSKKSQSESEEKSLKSLKNQEWWPIMDKMNFLYSSLQKKVYGSNIKNVLDFHELFNKFNSSHTVFYDNSHCNIKGDLYIAKEYCKFLIENKLIE